jgi:hypothetical protein
MSGPRIKTQEPLIPALLTTRPTYQLEAAVPKVEICMDHCPAYLGSGDYAGAENVPVKGDRFPGAGHSEERREARQAIRNPVRGVLSVGGNGRFPACSICHVVDATCLVSGGA